MTKKRISLPPETAARVLFEANRTCCVCRIQSKPIQIHHIDENPANHSIANLAVLCFDCHRETQITGGFDRKLDADQVLLYRDDWVRLVSEERSRDTAAQDARQIVEEKDLALAMTLAEIYREARAYVKLAIHYDVLGNVDLRDKYIELALSEGEPDDDTVVFLRGLQGRPDRIPQKVRERHLKTLTDHKSWSQRARAFKVFGMDVEAAADYVLSVHEDLKEGRHFPAAFYLKELSESGLIARLFETALREARQQGDLWWQVRALQELGWRDALGELVLENAALIDAMDVQTDPTAAMLRQLLARARGDEDELAEARKQEATASIARAAAYRAARNGLANKALQPTSRKARPRKARRARPARG